MTFKFFMVKMGLNFVIYVKKITGKLSKIMSEATIEFIAAARRYCKWMESNYRPDLKSTMQALELITELYLCAVRLSSEVKNMEYTNARFAKIREKFRGGCRGSLPINCYSEIFNPISVPAEAPITGTLHDDITDIYRDISRGLSLLDAGYRQHAVRKWIVNMQIHWGRHATSAIRVLHSYLSQEEGFI